MAEILNFTRGWDAELVRKDPGDLRSEILPILPNIVVVLREHPKMLGFLAFDKALHEIVVQRPWPEVVGNGLSNSQDWREYPRTWEPDIDEGHALLFVEQVGIHVRALSHPTSAARMVAEENPIDSLAMRLADLPEWDGIGRLEDVPKFILGAEGTVFERAAFKRCLISSVARTKRPGCKADCMIVLEGEQGSGKSTFVQEMPLHRKEVGEVRDFEDVKRLGETIRGKTIIEVEELAALSKGKVEAVKAAISRQFDTYRPPYAKKAMDFQRTCIFVGTTNAEFYLKDATGHRRFHPIRCGVRNTLQGNKNIAIGWWKANRAQIWAEAVWLYKQGEPWHLSEKEEIDAKVAQEERVDLGFWEEAFIAYIAGFVVGAKMKFTEAYAHLQEVVPGERVQQDAMAHILKKNGWQKERTPQGRIWRKMRV